VTDDALEVGASLGNSALWVNTKSTGAVERLFHVAIGQSLIGAITIRYATEGIHTGGPVQGNDREPTGRAYTSLGPAVPGSFEIHPAFQRHRFSLAGSIEVSETLFVPLTADPARLDSPSVLYQIVELHNGGPSPLTIRVLAFARLRGTLAGDVSARYASDLRALVAHNASAPHAVRVFGTTEALSGYATSFDFARAYEQQRMRPLEGSTEAMGDVLGCLQVDVPLDAGETRRFAVITAVSAEGEEDAIQSFRAAQDFDAALDATIDHLSEALARADVLTPDPLINQGAMWSKINMLRVMARYPQGPAFTNEPGVSSNVVGRDAAWFVYGNDHFQPGFSRALLESFARLQYPGGKIPEYYNALSGQVDDYQLNINDDTPLFILAVNHHFRASGDLPWLRGIYPAVATAARYIISQEDERGLVFCTAKDPRGNVWGIASWRNVIPDYCLNGAVTEINAECAAALRAAGHLAQNLEQPDEEAQTFFAAAAALRAAMDRHLLNPQNGLYYLNIDADGNSHTDVTGDQVFPVMFRVCDEDVGFRIISRLNSPDFWTAAGLRTASRDDPLYDPSRFVGLIGGVWPGLTWWYAFAAARYHPEFMVKALRASFEHYSANPKVNNTVPGQFSEWFDGESLVNRGMRLSPWEPPRFLWAAVEGVCGLMLTPDVPQINPLIPPAWKWVALRRVPYHYGELSYFAARHAGGLLIYTDGEIRAPHATERYEEDVSTGVHAFSASAEVVALRRAGELMILVGNVGTETVVVPLDVHELLDPAATFAIRIYNSERGAWESESGASGGSLGSLAVSIEEGGFRAIELRGAPDVP
jgi:hypothetical protein